MKYFEALRGQQHIVKRLVQLAESGNLPHSLLLYGEKGLGKLSVAMGLASLLIGRQVFSNDVGQTYLRHMEERRIREGESESAVKGEGLPIYVDKGEAFWLRPMKSQFKVEQWYGLLTDYLQQASAARRVVIVEDFHKANDIMANAMLKTIEEPPEGVYFIIVTNQIDRVLPTIKSRCMQVGFQRDSHIQAYSERMEENRSFTSAMAVMEKIVARGPFFTDLGLMLDGFSREELIDVCAFLRHISRDILALRYGGSKDVLQFPHLIDSMMNLLSKWSNRALFQIIPLTLEVERALQLNVKAALVVDRLLIGLRRAVKEDIR